MKVLFDHQCFTNQEYGGISRYFVSLINEFEKLNDIESNLALKYSNNYYISRLSRFGIKPFFKDKNFRGKKLTSHLINLPHSNSLISKGEFDIFHPTYYNPYFLKTLVSRPFVLTVYDMTHELFPDIIHWIDKTVEQKKFLVNKAKKVIAISENTKNDLLKILRTDETKIEVIHLASSLSPENSENKSDMNLPDKYILYVGSRNYYKNFDNLLSAFKQLSQTDDQLNLICAGGGRFSDAEKNKFNEYNLNSKVLYRPADDNSLAVLYSNALLFVFPSKYEGFGIPILEAMNCGCPMAVSNCSSLPEVAGASAVYFDPNDPSDIYRAIDKIIYNETTRNELISIGKIKKNDFSWQKTAAKTKKVYESIL